MPAIGEKLDEIEPLFELAKPGEIRIIGEKAEEVEAVAVEGDVDEEEEEEEGEDSWSSDSEIGDALDWLDTRDGNEAGVDGPITLKSRRPNAHGGLHARPNASTLQPLSNRNQRFSGHIHASPLEVCLIFLFFPRMVFG